jgi:transposase-like protein
MTEKRSAEKTVRDIRRRTRKKYSPEEKIRIVLEGLRSGRPAHYSAGGCAQCRGNGSATARHLCRRNGWDRVTLIPTARNSVASILC